jgi:very-short-patch-repair endonuclease
MVYLGISVERDMYYGAKPELFRLAEAMRKNSTYAEKALWKYLKKFRSESLVFRRQHPIDFYIADFYCHKIKLVIEVDGDIHLNEENFKYDDSRSGELERFGIKVIRFRNEDVLSNINSVIAEINMIISELASPSLLGEGDGRG